ncbi:MAG: hypothetical protein KKG59_03685 [Nanoarchaeota archaeon]|nr:hypothetical protein [Nanoarchaeota archaeon]
MGEGHEQKINNGNTHCATNNIYHTDNQSVCYPFKNMKKTKKTVGKNKVKTAHYVIGLIVIIAIVSIASISFPKGDGPEEKELLAKCLTEKGYKLAGTSWCGHCKNQRDMFGEALQFIDYHDCDDEAEWCQEMGVKAYPTWISPLGTATAGVKDFDLLRQISECR